MKLDANKIILLLIMVIAFLFIMKMFQEYQKTSLEKDRLNLEAQQITQNLVNQNQGSSGGGSFLSDLPLIGGFF